VDDEGPGIPDVSLAMQEGYSTATAEMREMGFGAGMGLPNIRKNADEFDISSGVGRGTKLIIRVTQIV
jgi:anti-sigma regulatory factor (Ser/Thr protein kinase)